MNIEAEEADFDRVSGRRDMP